MSLSLKAKLFSWVIQWLTKESVNPRDIPLSDFDKIQYEIRPCDVLLIDGRSRISEVIKVITQSSWSHAALYIGRLRDIENPLLRKRIQEFYDGDTGAQLVIESIIGKGTIVSPLTNYKNEHIRICRPKSLSRIDAQQVVGFAIGKLGLAYDVRQIFDLGRFLLPWHILPRRWRSTLFTYNPGTSTKQSCSALIASAFYSVHFPVLPVLKNDKINGLQLQARNPRLYTPCDFDFSPFFEIIKYPIFELSERGVYRDLPWIKQHPAIDEPVTAREVKQATITAPDPPPAAKEPEAQTATKPKKFPSRIWDFFD